MVGLSSVLVASLLAAAPAGPKLLVLPLTAGEGVSEGTAKALSATVIGEIRKRSGHVTLAVEDVQALLSVERQRQLLGCSESSCLAEVGGALGVDQVVNGSVARLGSSFLLHLQVLDAVKAKVLRSSDRRKKGAGLDDVLDEIPAMVDELFGAAPVVTPPPPPAPSPAIERRLPKVSLPPPALDEPKTIAPAVLAKLQVVTDGKGNYLALVPFVGMDEPFFAGSAEKLWAQEVHGGGSNGTSQFSLNFWDPRTRSGAEAELDFRDGKYTLTCNKQEIAYARLAPKEERAFLSKAKLLAQRWRRQAVALGHDEDGTYYYVDAPRADGSSDDLHLFIGRKGQLVPVRVTSAQREDGRLFVESDAGTLSIPTGDDEAARKVPGRFHSQSGDKAVTALDLWSNRTMIYTALGAYTGERLGTACDPYLK